MIRIEQTISPKDYRKIIWIHYFAKKTAYIAPAVGIIAFIVFAESILRDYQNAEVADLILLFIALFVILRPFHYIQRAYKSALTNRILFQRTLIKIDKEDYLRITVEGHESNFKLRGLYRYLEKKDFLLLYSSADQYFILDRRKISDLDYSAIIGQLKRLNIKAL